MANPILRQRLDKVKQLIEKIEQFETHIQRLKDASQKLSAWQPLSSVIHINNTPLCVTRYDNRRGGHDLAKHYALGATFLRRGIRAEIEECEGEIKKLREELNLIKLGEE